MKVRRPGSVLLAAALVGALTPAALLGARDADGPVRGRQEPSDPVPADDFVGRVRKSVERDPRNADPWTQLGLALKADERLPEAIAAFNEALALEPAHEAARLGLADAYRRIPNYEEARRLLEQTASEHPASAGPLVALGELEIELQRYDAAVTVLRRAIDLDPGQTVARAELGAAYRAKNEPAAAIAALNDAIARDPSLALAYYFRGATYADQNRNDAALADARKAVELLPDGVPGRILLASVAVRVGECAEAVATLEPLAATRPDDGEALFLLSRAYQCAGQGEKAREATARFAEANKREQSGRESRTQSLNLVIKAGELARSNQMVPALEALREAIEKDPDNSNAYAQLAKIYFSAGMMAEAKRAIDRALGGNPHHPDYLYVLGRVLAQEGDYAGALSAFEQNVLINPQDAEAYFQIGLVLVSLKRLDDAVAALKKAVELDPQDEEYRNALATLDPP